MKVALYSPAVVLVAWAVAIAITGSTLDIIFFVALALSLFAHVRAEHRLYRHRVKVIDK